MGFSYVIGECFSLSAFRALNVFYYIEHMEDDEETSRAIPKWVELEYSVRTISRSSPSSPIDQLIFLLANAQFGWPRLACTLHASLFIVMRDIELCIFASSRASHESTRQASSNIRDRSHEGVLCPSWQSVSIGSTSRKGAVSRRRRWTLWMVFIWGKLSVVHISWVGASSSNVETK